MKLNTKLFLITVVLLGVIWVGLQWLNQRHAFITDHDLASASIYPEPKALQPFQLREASGQVFTEKNLLGQWSLVFFGFTNCPSICPTSMAVLNQVYNKVNNAAKPQVIFVSVDPERDTLKRIGQYVQGFNPHFIGVKGQKEQIDALARQMSVLYIKLKPETGNNYTIDHSGAILLINPQGKLHAVFTAPLDAEKMVKDYSLIVANS